MTVGEFAKIRHGNLAWRILLELAGRDRPMTLQELCETLEVEPLETQKTLTNLGIDHHADLKFYPDRWAITWQGRDALGRVSDQHDRVRLHWWHKHRFDVIWWATGAVLIYIISLLIQRWT